MVKMADAKADSLPIGPSETTHTLARHKIDYEATDRSRISQRSNYVWHRWGNRIISHE